MASLENQNRILEESMRTLEAYKRVFNSTARETISDSEDMVAEFDRLRDALDRLSSDADGLNNIKDSIRFDDAGQLADFESRVRSLDSALKSLAPSLDKAVSGINRALDSRIGSGATVDIGNVSSGYADNASSYMQQIPKFTTGSQEYMDTLRALQDAERSASQAARGRVEQTLSAVKGLADGVNNAVNRIISSIRSAISIVNRIFGTIGNVMTTIGSTIRNIIMLFGNLGNRVREAFSSADKEGNKFNSTLRVVWGSATELRSTILLLKGAFDKLFNNQAIAKAETLFASVYSLRNIGGKQVTQDVIDWANSMERAFGLSARDLISDLNELTGVLYGLGMSAEDTAIGSENILIMSRYLAFMGAAGGKTDVVMQKLVSGIKGMTQAIDDLGLSVRDAQMDAFLKELKSQGGEFANISTSFQSLNEQARVYVRYAALIKQFTDSYDITSFVNALDTVTGRVNIFKQTVSSLVTTFGQGMYNIFSVLAGYLTPVIKYIENLVVRLFGWIYKFLGIEKDLNISPDMNNNADAVDNVRDSVSDVNDELDETEEKSKKASGGLQSWDRVNNITSSKDDGRDSSKDAFDYSKLMTSMLDRLNQMAAEAEQGYFDRMTDKLKQKIDELRDRLLNFAKEITGREDFDLGFDWEKIKNNLKNVLGNVGKLIKDWGKFAIEISLKILDDVNIGLIITKLTELLSVISDVAVQVSDVLIPAFRALYDNGLSPIVKYIGEQVVAAIDFMISELKKWGDWFTENKDTIVTFFGNLGLVVNAVFEAVRPIFDLAWEWLGEKISGLNDNLRELFSSKMEQFNENIDGTLDKIKQLGEVLTHRYTLDTVVFLNTDTSELSEADAKWQGILKTVEKIRNVLEGIPDKVKEIVEILTGKESLDTVVDLNTEPNDDVWLNFIQILHSVKEIGDIVGETLVELFKDFAAFTKEEGLPWLNEKLKELSTWLNEHKDDLVELVEKLAGFAWDSFKIFVDVVAKLIDYVVENPDSVINFFEGLLALKVASWFTAVASSIGMVVLRMTALSKLGSISAMLGGGAAAAGGGAAAAGGLAGIGAALGPILAVVAAVGALVAVLTTLWNTSETFRDTVKGMFDMLGESFKKVVEVFTGTNTETGKSEGIIQRLKEAWTAFSQALEPIIDLIITVVTPALSVIIDWVGRIASVIGTVLVNALNGAAGLINLFIGLLTGDWDKALKGAKQAVGAFVDTVLSVLGDLVGSVGDIITEVINAFVTFGGDTINGFWQGIKDTWDGFIEGVTKLWEEFLNSVRDFFGIHSPSTLFAEIGRFLLEGLLGGITAGWENLKETVINLATELWQGIQDTFAGVHDWFSERFTSAKERAVEAWSDAQERFNEIKENVLSGFSDLVQRTADNFSEAKTSAVARFDDIRTVFAEIANRAADGLRTLIGKASSIFSDIKSNATNVLNGIADKLNGLKSKASSVFDSIRSSASNILNSIGDRLSSLGSSISSRFNTGSAQSITSHAVGGSIAGGQLFIANENGDAELIGNIDGSQKTNVANNNMIIEAMRRAVFEAVYNALAEVKNQDRGFGNGGNGAKITIDGFGLIDSSTLRELARMLAPYLNSNATNIADIGFSI